MTGLVAAAENMPSGSALRPGDVITHFGGRTVEVLNTDAEGRLVMADALAYADAVLQPDVMVDIATLTGAARVALGTHMAALYASDDRVARDLLAAADASGDALWRMPLVDDYRDALDSPVAELANVPHGSRLRAGSITRPSSCASSPAGGPGRTSTSPVPPGHRPMRERTPRARRGSAPGCCSPGWRRPTPRLTAVSRPSPTGSSSGTRRSSCADQPGHLPDGRRFRVAQVGSATRPPQSALSKATTPPGRSSRRAAVR